MNLRQWVQALGRALPPGSRRVIRSTSRILSARAASAMHPEVVETLDAWAELNDLTSALHQALVAAGVDAEPLELASEMTIVIPEDQREAAFRALHRDARARNWHITRGIHGWQPLSMADPAAFNRKACPIFRILAAPNGTILLGPEMPVILRFIPPQGQGADQLPIRPPHERHLLRLTDQVDVVYTWVDDSDPAWLNERARVRPDAKLATDALSPSRTTDRGELRYSLRSLAMYANWVRHIWIVTSGQVPTWLDIAHPRVTVVPHDEIFSDTSALPTFNSHAIESQLHHINGLAEHFLYLNDDVFFGRPAEPQDFFHGNGIAKFMISNVAIDREPDKNPRNGAMLAARNNRTLIEDLWKRTTTHRMQHVPHAHRRSSLQDLEHRRPDVFDQVAKQRFRSPTDISVASELGHYHAYALGLATPGSLSFRYIDIASPFAAEYFAELRDGRPFKAFCVNDVSMDRVPNDQVTKFLEEYFPLPSPFELP